MPSKKTAKKQYVVSLVDGVDNHVGTGDSIYEALSSVKPFSSKKMVNIVVEFGDLKSKIPLKLNPLKIRRMFMNEMDRRLQAKRLETLV